MLRVDFNSPITEKDPESGYFLFEYPDAGKTYAGSAEVVRVTDGGNEAARVVFQLPGLPSYYEQMLLDRLTRKLEQDYGSPTEPKPPAETEPERGKKKEAGEGEKRETPEGERQQPGSAPAK